MFQAKGCRGCRLLTAALPHIRDRWDIVAAMLRASQERAGLSIADLVVIVGRPELLPESLRGRGAVAMMTAERAKLFDRYPEPLASAFAPLASPPPAGHVWVVASIGTQARGAVVVFFHRAPTAPSSAAEKVLALALVPEDGGPAPGAGISARGGCA